MSSFLSNKYLRYRKLLAGGTPAIAHDVHCIGCGYNLRGLNAGRKCPECGTVIPLELQSNDPLLSGTLREKAAMTWGLTFMASSAAVIVAMRLFFAVTWALVRNAAAPLWMYIALGLGAWSGWCAGAMLVLPRRLDSVHPARRWLRLAGRWSQITWPIAMLLWLLAETSFGASPAGNALLAWSLLLRVLAGAGALALAVALQQMAEDAELDDAPRRIGLALYVVPILATVMLLIPLGANFLILALMSPILLAWAWYGAHFALGVWEMRQAVAWSLRMGVDMGDREARIEATRRELDREAQKIVRDLPPRSRVEKPLEVD